jgi:drug/metabolite transporter (DMT)-like permease
MNAKGFLFAIIVSLGYAGSSVLLKFGMNKMGKSTLASVSDYVPFLLKSVMSPYILLGLLVTLLSTIFYLDLLSKYTLNLVYPLLSLMYIFVAIGGILFLGERLTLLNWLGIAFICAGVGILSLKV